MHDFAFLSWDELLILHEDELAEYGGQQGFLDEGIVRSVMSRAQFTAQYADDADVADLAAEYLYGFATTQGFLDGNKRTALVATLYFLRKNGWNMVVTERLMYLVSIAVARGELDKESLSEIIRSHIKQVEEDE